MASVSTQKKTGLRRVIFQSSDGRRVSLHVGKLSRGSAREIVAHVDHLVACRRSGSDVRRLTREWIDHIHTEWPQLSHRLARLGLITDGVRTDLPFVDFAEDWISSRRDVKPNTIRAWRQTAGKVREFYGDRKLTSLTVKDGSDFLRWLVTPAELGGAGHQASSAGKHLAFARGFLNEAVDAGILTTNPFQRVKSDRTVDRSRHRFIPAEVIVRVMAATPDRELRAVMALSRWGGLRTPSEPFALRWEQIDWQRRRITVPGVKTKIRQIPLFPELVPVLGGLRDRAGMEEFLFPGLRRFSDANLRKRMGQLIRLAGIPIWPKLFQNLRSSRQTELEERFPRKTVCEWMGNSEQVADQHYLQVREEHFEAAVAGVLVSAAGFCDGSAAEVSSFSSGSHPPVEPLGGLS